MADQFPRPPKEINFPVKRPSAFTSKATHISQQVPSLEASIWYNLLQKPRYKDLESRLSPQQQLFRESLLSEIRYFIFCLEANAYILLIPGLEDYRSMLLELFKTFSSILKTYLAQPSCDRENLLTNTEFLHSLLALCFEMFLFTRNITELSFERLISTLEVSVFDFWKQMNYFAMVYHPVPTMFLVHFKEINCKILNQAAWKENSGIFTDLSDSLSQYAYSQFFKKLVPFIDRRIAQAAKHIGLSHEVQAEVLAKAKFFLSEYTEHIKDKKVDLVLLCSFYYVCKQRCEIPVFQLLGSYKSALGVDRVEDGKDEYGLVNLYLNDVYLTAMKSYSQDKAFRIKELDSADTLKRSPVTKNSPAFVSPRTLKMCDVAIDVPIKKPKLSSN